MSATHLDIVTQLKEKLAALAPELTALQIINIVDLVEPVGVQLFFTGANGRSVQRLIRHYLNETGFMPKAPKLKKMPGLPAPCGGDVNSWPTNLREKAQFATNVLEVLVISERAALEKREREIDRIGVAIDALQNVKSFSAVTDAIEELEEERTKLIRMRDYILRAKPWILHPVPHGVEQVLEEQKASRSRLHQDEDDDDFFADDE